MNVPGSRLLHGIIDGGECGGAFSKELQKIRMTIERVSQVCWDVFADNPDAVIHVVVTAEIPLGKAVDVPAREVVDEPTKQE